MALTLQDRSVVDRKTMELKMGYQIQKILYIQNKQPYLLITKELQLTHDWILQKKLILSNYEQSTVKSQFSFTINGWKHYFFILTSDLTINHLKQKLFFCNFQTKYHNIQMCYWICYYGNMTM